MAWIRAANWTSWRIDHRRPKVLKKKQNIADRWGPRYLRLCERWNDMCEKIADSSKDTACIALKKQFEALKSIKNHYGETATSENVTAPVSEGFQPAIASIHTSSGHQAFTLPERTRIGHVLCNLQAEPESTRSL